MEANPGTTGARASVSLLAPMLVGLLALGAGSASADEVAVSKSAMQDIEFDHDDALVEWVDTSHRLWVAQVDTTTGNFIPSTGMGTQVDSNVTYAGSFGNGPEWVQSTSGYGLIYNKFNPPRANATDPSQTYFAYAALTGSTWKISTLPNTLGFVEPNGNLNPTESNPPVVFHDGNDPNSPLYIMGIHDSQPVAVPLANPQATSADTKGSSRFVPGLTQMVYTADVTVNGQSARQVFSYDYSTGVTSQLTFEASNKGDVFIFQAPELANTYVMAVSVNRKYLSFYTYKYNTTTHTSAWTLLRSVYPPQGALAPPFLFSAEPFTYKNKSYMFMVRSTASDSTNLAIPTEIWVASMDGTYYARVSNSASADPAVRSDPEYFNTSGGCYIYYLRYSLADPLNGIKSQPQGVRRSNSGIH